MLKNKLKIISKNEFFQQLTECLFCAGHCSRHCVAVKECIGHYCHSIYILEKEIDMKQVIFHKVCGMLGQETYRVQKDLLAVLG